MATTLEDTSVTYEDLADIEKDFDDAETEIIRHQVTLTAPIYARRQKIVSQIPNFWPLVLEQAPPDIDQFIQPSDSALLLSSLTSLSISHFQIDVPKEEGGDPRSFAIRLEFSENEYFEDSVLEKKFWYRRAKNGWTGLVSEPVGIKWKKGEDLTGGLLDLVCAAWEAEQRLKSKQENNGEVTKTEVTDEQRALKTMLEQTSMGGLSFFAWFGFIGRRVGADESIEALKLEDERRDLKRSGSKVEIPPIDDDEDDEDDLGTSLEIFPDGDELAIAIKEDLWPDAIKYFTQAQEEDALSDEDFESDDEPLNSEVESVSDDAETLPPSKKQKF